MMRGESQLNKKKLVASSKPSSKLQAAVGKGKHQTQPSKDILSRLPEKKKPTNAKMTGQIKKIEKTEKTTLSKKIPKKSAKNNLEDSLISDIESHTLAEAFKNARIMEQKYFEVLKKYKDLKSRTDKQKNDVHLESRGKEKTITLLEQQLEEALRENERLRAKIVNLDEKIIQIYNEEPVETYEIEKLREFHEMQISELKKKIKKSDERHNLELERNKMEYEINLKKIVQKFKHEENALLKQIEELSTMNTMGTNQNRVRGGGKSKEINVNEIKDYFKLKKNMVETNLNSKNQKKATYKSVIGSYKKPGNKPLYDDINEESRGSYSKDDMEHDYYRYLPEEKDQISASKMSAPSRDSNQKIEGMINKILNEHSKLQLDNCNFSNKLEVIEHALKRIETNHSRKSNGLSSNSQPIKFHGTLTPSKNNFDNKSRFSSIQKMYPSRNNNFVKTPQAEEGNTVRAQNNLEVTTPKTNYRPMGPGMYESTLIDQKNINNVDFTHVATKYNRYSDNSNQEKFVPNRKDLFNKNDMMKGKKKGKVIIDNFLKQYPSNPSFNLENFQPLNYNGKVQKIKLENNKPKRQQNYALELITGRKNSNTSNSNMGQPGEDYQSKEDDENSNSVKDQTKQMIQNYDKINHHRSYYSNKDTNTFENPRLQKNYNKNNAHQSSENYQKAKQTMGWTGDYQNIIEEIKKMKSEIHDIQEQNNDLLNIIDR